MGRWQDILESMKDDASQRAAIPFVDTLDLPPVKEWSPGAVTMEWQVDERVFHPRGAVFGGYIAALADRVLGTVTMTVLEDHEAFTTADLNVAFFRPVSSGILRIEAKIIHRGRSLVQTEVEFIRDDGKLSNKASATQAIIPYEETTLDSMPG
jgi:uncharacterized protein (TIGR00369 family)